MTGRDAVKYFAACHHLGKIQSVYFNLKPSRHYNPYDLISVPKDKVKYRWMDGRTDRQTDTHIHIGITHA